MAICRSLTRPYAGPWDPTNRFETSWILPLGLLFAIRALFSLYTFVTYFTIFGWNGSHGLSQDSRHSFSYFTDLTYWGLGFYFAFSALHTATYWLTGTPLLARWPKGLQIAHSMFYATIVVYPWVVTAVYWGLLAPSRFASTFALWTNTSQHAINSLYAFFEIFFPRTEPPAWLDLVPIIVLLCLYLGLAYLTHATERFWVYSFLDPQKHSSGIVAAYIIGILVGSMIVFLLVRYFIMLRIWLVESKLGNLALCSQHRETATVGEEKKTHSLPPLHGCA